MYVDTNVIIRAILNDHKTLSPKAQKFFRKAKAENYKLKTVDLVIGELFWVLESKKLEPTLKKSQIADIILSFVNLVNLKFPSESIFTEAVEIYRNNKLDIADIFLYLSAKRTNKKLVTFDKKLANLEYWT